MRPVRQLSTAGILFFLVLVLLSGMTLISTAWNPDLRSDLVSLLEDSPETFAWSGAGLILLALGLMGAMARLYRGSSLCIEMQQHTLSVSNTIIQQHIDTYWENRLPKDSVKTEVYANSNRLEIYVRLPPIETEKQANFLQQTESDLGDILATNFDYRKTFLFCPSFLSIQDQS